MNPIGSSLIVLGLVPDLNRAVADGFARRIAVNCLLVLTVSFVVGAYLLTFFAISLPILRAAGGCVIAIAGWRLLQAPDTDASGDPPSAATPASILSAKAFYPIAFPITVGPGSMSVAIALEADVSNRPFLSNAIGVACALISLACVIYLCMRYVGKIQKVLGHAGSRAMSRIFAFVLFCIGAQVLWLGLSALTGWNS